MGIRGRGSRGIVIPSSFPGGTHRQEKTSFSRLLKEAISRPRARTSRGGCVSPATSLTAPATESLVSMLSLLGISLSRKLSGALQLLSPGKRLPFFPHCRFGDAVVDDMLV